MAIHLTEADIERLLPYPELVDTLESALRDQDAGGAGNHPRRRFFLGSTVFHHMAAHWDARGTMGTKCYASARGGTRFLVELFDSRNGELLATIDADLLGRRRTGAATAVAARHMAIPDPREAAILGAGGQAVAQVEALAAAFPKLRRFRIWSRDRTRAAGFAEARGASIDATFEHFGDVDAAVDGADLVVCVTSAREPILSSRALAPHAFVAAVGANRLAAREIDESVVAGASVVVVDDLEQARDEAMELHAAHQKLKLRWERVAPLCSVVAGTRPGRPVEGKRTLFKSLGIALEDIAAATLAHANRLRELEAASR